MKKIIILSILILTSCSSREFKESDHYSQETDKFFNTTVKADKGLYSFLRWKLFTTPAKWPEKIEIDPKPSLLSPKSLNDVNITFVNHSTFLIQINGYNILTDPVWSERVSPVSFAGPKRVHPPGVTIEELPKIDIVLISHNHYDHLDIESIKKLEKKFSPAFFVPLGDKELLKSAGVQKVFDLDWWNKVNFNNIDISFVPTQHWSARGIFDRFDSLWGGYVVAWNGHKIFFGGDTGYSKHFKSINSKFGPMDISLIPIGAYAPRWFMQTMHMDPEEAIWAHKDLKSRYSIGMHYGTFQLTNESIDEPKTKLGMHLKKEGISPETFLLLPIGHTKQFKL